MKTTNRLESYIKNRVKKQAIKISSGTIKTFNFQSILIGARNIYLLHSPITFDNIVKAYYYKHKKIYSNKLQSLNNSKSILDLFYYFDYINIFRLFQYLFCVDIVVDLKLNEVKIIKQALYIATWYASLEIEDEILSIKHTNKYSSVEQVLQQQSINIILNIQDRFDITFIYKFKDINKAKIEYKNEKKKILNKFRRITTNKTIQSLQHKYNSINVLGLAKFLIFNNKISLKSSKSLSIFEDILKLILNIRLEQPYYNNKNEWIDNIYPHKNDPNYNTSDIEDILNNHKKDYTRC